MLQTPMALQTLPFGCSIFHPLNCIPYHREGIIIHVNSLLILNVILDSSLSHPSCLPIVSSIYPLLSIIFAIVFSQLITVASFYLHTVALIIFLKCKTVMLKTSSVTPIILRIKYKLSKFPKLVFHKIWLVLLVFQLLSVFFFFFFLTCLVLVPYRIEPQHFGSEGS